MYTIDELLNLLKTEYPNEIPPFTHEKRIFNIETLKNVILKDIQQNELKYKEKERRILLYTTEQNEEIYIQYPGKYSAKYPFDFRPITRTTNSNDSIDLDFQGLWRILDKYIHRHEDFMPIFNNLIFRIGRMINHEISIRQYSTFLVYNDGDYIEPSEKISFPMYQFMISDSILRESLNFHARKIDVGNGVNISLEAFLYYLDSIIQIEDCKYKTPSINDDHGRIATSDSLIVIYSYHIGTIDLAEMLQRFVKYRGIAHCAITEYAPASDNTIAISNTSKRLEELCTNNNISFHKKKLLLTE